MNGVNKAILIGHIGKDPELRHTTSGDAVTNFSLATTEKWRDKNTGQQSESTEWHRCVAFGRLAEIIMEYCTKGDPLYIEGKIKTRKWQDKSGQDRYTTEVQVLNMQMLGSRQQSGGQQQARAQQSDNGFSNQPSNTSAPTADFDDDIPF